ncbi:MAG: EAL domain-containing protein [Steroidobacteraceae bacterium]
MRFNPGLQARLLLAFGAVAVLAVATNLLAERTVRVVVDRVWSAPAAAPVPRVVATVTEPEAVEPEPALEPVRQSRPVRRADYAAAIEDFERAIQSRIASADPAAQRALEASTASLDRQFVLIQGDLGNSRRTLKKNLAQDRDVLQERATAAIAQADQQRDARLEYARVADELADVTRKKMDGAWRFLGRVIARQQMVELRDRTEELRRLVVRQSAGESVIPALARVEAAIAALVPAAPARPAKAGAEPDWDDRIRSGLVEAAKTRERLDGLERTSNADEEQRALKVAAALAHVAALPATIEVTLAAPPGAAPKALKGRPVSPAMEVPVPNDGAETVASAEPSVSSTVDSADADRAAKSRVLLITLSIGVVLLTLSVTLLTVRSLMRQIRRLIEGSRRVARGEAASVEAGGIRELDALAGEFNAMSAQLALARGVNERHQQDLESRVVERTTQLHFQAAHDPLTLLPNRRELSRLLEQALVDARNGERRIGVFLVDLDNFKVVNDGMGHAFGDKVLIAMAERLRSLTPPGGFAARLGGDEFTVVAADADVDAIRATGWSLVRAFQQPLQIEGRELILSVSVGASLCPDHAQDADGLLRAADSALFRAKALGRSQLALFSPEMLDAAESRFSTEQSLRRAVERGEFELVYQPEVDSVSFEVTSVEALLRWRLPDGRSASPGEFLAVAEESGLITEISEWVLREAVAAAGRWYRGGWKDVRVAINVSSRQLVDLGFVPRLAELLAEHGLPPSAIEIELTENVLQTGAHTVTTLQGLRQLGVATALDDFGTGYSSLASLEQLPLTRVKLDRSLVASIDSSSRSAAISRAILGLCDGLGLAVTAEGIERLAQFDVLMRYQPLTLQGFLLARPLPESKVLEARAAMPGHLTGLLLSGPDDTQLRPALAAPAVVASARTG